MKNIHQKPKPVNRNLTTLRAKYRRRYECRKAAGLCTAYGKVAPRPDRGTCAACGKVQSEREKRRRERKMPIFRKLHVCINCKHRSAIDGKRYCGYCMELNAESKARTRAKRAAIGQCIDCPENAAPGKLRCPRCLGRSLAAQMTYLAAKKLRGAA